MAAKFITFAFLALFAAPLITRAEEAAYKAEDIVKFFDNAAHGATRGICVGTEEECGTAETGTKPLSFNLLVNFEKNSANLTESARTNLLEFSRALTDPRLNSARFAIDGYTDASGTESYNLGLSERRAKSVVSFLAEQGVDASKLAPAGHGETNPRAEDPFDPVNRRVEAKLAIQ